MQVWTGKTGFKDTWLKRFGNLYMVFEMEVGEIVAFPVSREKTESEVNAILNKHDEWHGWTLIAAKNEEDAKRSYVKAHEQWYLVESGEG